MSHYTYRAEWSTEDDEYVGLVAEFPSLSWLAPTAAEAIAGVSDLVGSIVADMVETGEMPPLPFAERRYSGNIALRTTPDQHRRLTIEATEQHVSLNQWIIQRLASPGSAANGAGVLAPPLAWSGAAAESARETFSQFEATAEELAKLLKGFAEISKSTPHPTVVRAPDK